MRQSGCATSFLGIWTTSDLLLLAGCAADNPLFNAQPAGSDGAGDHDTKGDDDDDAAPDDDDDDDAAPDDDDDDAAPDDDDDDDASEDEAGKGEDTSGGSTGNDDGRTIDCDDRPAAIADYRPCFAGGCPERGECFEDEAGPPVYYGVSVCAPLCDEDCDCPRVQGAPDLFPLCEDDHCVLECGDDLPCPGGMTCFEDRCVWTDAYGPCGGEQCLSGRCVENGPNAVCATLDCWDDGDLTIGLCPQAPSSTAQPFCFEPQNPPKFNGEGWCVIQCGPGGDCPTGMECIGSLCMHPN